MFAYLNDFSLRSESNTTKDCRTLLFELIETTLLLKDDYLIEFIKVPKDFRSHKIGKQTIDELIENSDVEDQQYIYNFISNRTDDDVNEIYDEILEIAEKKGHWISIEFEGSKSDFLTGAQLKKMPIVSFTTAPQYCNDEFHCNFVIDSGGENVTTTPISFFNIHESSTCERNQKRLLEIKKDIKFGIGKWKPSINPIWNDKTKTLLADLEFPKSKANEKIAELIYVGNLVAELNCWVYDHEITSINRSRHKIRKIYNSSKSLHINYLSIDFENAKGTFELYDKRGSHIGQISFIDGSFIKRGNDINGKDATGEHDLKLKK